jgi:predicted RNase H-like nuclease (RuvC/YqgF family)
MAVSRLEGDLETERERVRSQREREEELRLKVLSLEGQITHKQQEVERLERMLEVVKQEASSQMHDRVGVQNRKNAHTKDMHARTHKHTGVLKDCLSMTLLKMCMTTYLSRSQKRK